MNSEFQRLDGPWVECEEGSLGPQSLLMDVEIDLLTANEKHHKVSTKVTVRLSASQPR